MRVDTQGLPAAGRATPPIEVLAPGEGLVRLLIADTPMSPALRAHTFPAGLSILEMLEQAQVKPRLAKLGVVMIDGLEVPRHLWERVRPRPGLTITFGVRPAGRGSLRTLLQILVAIAVIVLIVFQQYWAAAIVAAVGNLAVSFIPPPRPRTSPESAPTYAIEGARNELRLFQPTPVVLGRRRMALVYAARPYTEVVGDDLHFRLLLTPGVGPAQIEDIRIGATSIGEFDAVEMEIRTGEPGEAPITLFSRQVIEDSPDTGLTVEAGEVVRDVPGGEVDEISADITFASGLALFDGRERKAHSVSFELDYRLVGDSEWRAAFGTPAQVNLAAGDAAIDRFLPPADLSGYYTALGGYVPAPAVSRTWTITSSETSPVRRSRRWAVPRGRYQVRLRRTTPNAEEGVDVIDQATWSALRGVRAEAPAVPPHTPLLALRIRASEQLQGQLDPITAIVTSIRPRFDTASPTGALLAPGPTRNPADLFLAIARGPGARRPLSASRIDFEGLAEWAALCAARGWTADLIIDDGRSVAEALTSIAAAGRARPVFRSGRVSVVVDVPRLTSGQMFTPRNTRNFRGRKTFAPRPHAYRVTFSNEEADYRVDERIVYAPGYDAATATEFDTIAFEPIVNPDRAAEMAAYYIAVQELRSEEYAFEMDREAAITEIGDRAYLVHDAILEGVGWGRITALLDQALAPADPAAAQIHGVELDAALDLSASLAYALRVRSADGTRVFALAVQGGALNRLRFAFAQQAATAPRIGDLVAVGVATQETLEVVVRSKGRPDADGVVEITCEPYAHPAIDQAASGDQGPWVSRVRPWAALPPTPQLNSALWSAEGVVVDFSVPSGPADALLAGFEARWRPTPDAGADTGWRRLPDLAPSDRRVVTPPPPVAADVDVEVLGYDAFGRRGRPLRVAGIASTESLAPPVVVRLEGQSRNGPQGSVPVLELEIAPQTDPQVASLIVQARAQGGTAADWRGLGAFDPTAAVHVIPGAGAPGAAIEGRVRFESRRGLASAWVGPLPAALPGAVATNVLFVGGRSVADLNGLLDQALAGAGGGSGSDATVESLQAQFADLSADVSDLASVASEARSLGQSNAASLTTQSQAIQDLAANRASTAELTTLQAEVTAARGTGNATLTARLGQLDQARVSGDAALAGRASALEAQISGASDSGLRARIAAEESARAGADVALAARASTLEAQLLGQSDSGLRARIAAEESARATVDQALANRASALEAQISGASDSGLRARIAAEESARAGADVALAARAFTLEAAAANPDRGQLNRSPAFQDWPAGQALPTGFRAVGGVTAARQGSTARRGAWALRLSGDAGANVWIEALGPPALLVSPETSWLVMEYEIGLVAGDLRRAGLLVRNRHQSDTDFVDFAVPFHTAHPGAQVGRIYRGAALVQASAASGAPTGAPTRTDLFVMLTWGSLAGGANVAKTLDFHLVSVRPATEAEIDARAAVSQLAGQAPSALQARIATEEQARLSADTALASRAATLEAQMGGGQDSALRARIAAEESARATADQALATRASTLEAQLRNETDSPLRARIVAEESARAGGDQALAGRASALEAQVAGTSASGLRTALDARITSVENAGASADAALAGRAATLEAQLRNETDSGLRARIAAEESARANAVSAVAGRTSTLEAQLAGQQASGLRAQIAAEESARADADGALATRASTLEAQLRNEADSGLRARIAAEEGARAGGDAALASRVTSVEAGVGGLSASVTQTSQALANLNGRLGASWTLELNANGLVSGLRATNDGRASSLVLDFGLVQARNVRADSVVANSITTENLVGQAVTSVTAVEFGQSANIQRSRVQLGAFVLPSSGGQMLMDLYLEWTDEANRNTGVVTEVYRNGVLIDFFNSLLVAQVPNSYAYHLTDAPGPGVHTYAIQALQVTANIASVARVRRLKVRVLEAKR